MCRGSEINTIYKHKSYLCISYKNISHVLVSTPIGSNPKPIAYQFLILALTSRQQLFISYKKNIQISINNKNIVIRKIFFNK